MKSFIAAALLIALTHTRPIAQEASGDLMRRSTAVGYKHPTPAEYTRPTEPAPSGEIKDKADVQPTDYQKPAAESKQQLPETKDASAPKVAVEQEVLTETANGPAPSEGEYQKPAEQESSVVTEESSGEQESTEQPAGQESTEVSESSGSEYEKPVAETVEVTEGSTEVPASSEGEKTTTEQESAPVPEAPVVEQATPTQSENASSGQEDSGKYVTAAPIKEETKVKSPAAEVPAPSVGGSGETAAPNTVQEETTPETQSPSVEESSSNVVQEAAPTESPATEAPTEVEYKKPAEQESTEAPASQGSVDTTESSPAEQTSSTQPEEYTNNKEVNSNVSGGTTDKSYQGTAIPEVIPQIPAIIPAVATSPSMEVAIPTKAPAEQVLSKPSQASYKHSTY